MNRTKTVERVSRAIAMRIQGSTHREIGLELGISQSTVRMWTDEKCAALHKANAVEWTRQNKEICNQRIRERRKNFTREQLDVLNAKQRARYASDPKVKARFRRLMKKYRDTAQGRLAGKVRLMCWGFAGRGPACFVPLMEAITGMTQEQFTERFGGDGNTDHIIPIIKFDLTNPQHLVRCNHPSNLRIIPSRENMLKGAKCEDVDVMTLPWSENPDALVQAQTFISRQLGKMRKATQLTDR